jgi:hypothetical protein
VSVCVCVCVCDSTSMVCCQAQYHRNEDHGLIRNSLKSISSFRQCLIGMQIQRVLLRMNYVDLVHDSMSMCDVTT